jgi:hypothetical protein
MGMPKGSSVCSRVKLGQPETKPDLREGVSV